jgi:hypothetical protein
MATIEMTFALSAPARRALAHLPSVRSLEFVAERFFDKVQHERYRDFAVAPAYFTSPHGHRLARAAQQRPRGEKLQEMRTTLTIKTFRGMKRLQQRGLSLTWQLEEILYFAYRHGFIPALHGGE